MRHFETFLTQHSQLWDANYGTVFHRF